MAETHPEVSLDGAIIGALEDIHKTATGLFSRVLILTNHSQSFGNDETSYISPVFSASSGGTDTFLKVSAYPNQDDARLSGRDSEVAALQEAADWLEGHRSAWAAHVILVANIGPCDPCKQRLRNFRAKLAERFGQQLTVQVIYDQSDASATRTRGANIPSVYGYPNAGQTPLSNQHQVWIYTVT